VLVAKKPPCEHTGKLAPGAIPRRGDAMRHYGICPVEQPTKFVSVLNLTTARLLRVPIPATVAVRVDETIQ
jgi:hypothetical protein